MASETIDGAVMTADQAGSWVKHEPDEESAAAFYEKCLAVQAERQAAIDQKWAWAPRWLPAILGVKLSPPPPSKEASTKAFILLIVILFLPTIIGGIIAAPFIAIKKGWDKFFQKPE
jgi:hypothetical protein